MMFGCWTEDMIWISLRILMRSASVSILLFLIVLIATCRKILSRSLFTEEKRVDEEITSENVSADDCAV